MLKLSFKRLRFSQFSDLRQFSSFLDITGINVSCSSEDAKYNLNQCITQVIVGGTDPKAVLREILQQDQTCSLAKSLLLLNLAKSPTNEALDEISKLQNNEVVSASADLDLRSKTLTTAIEYWINGRHLQFADILETYLQKNTSDILILRLLQDAYVAAGKGDQALRCILRHSDFLTTSNPILQASVSQMFTLGLSEVGRLAEAEETGLKAVKRTKGKDILALHSLMNVYQISGKTSEIISTMEQYRSQHEQKENFHLLLFNLGTAFVLRGNCQGGYTTFCDILLRHFEVGTGLKSTELVYATMLLWQIELNIEDREMVPFDLTWKWLVPSELPKNSFSHFFAAIVALSSSINVIEATSKTHVEIDQMAVKTEGLKEEGGSWFGSFFKNRESPSFSKKKFNDLGEALGVPKEKRPFLEALSIDEKKEKLNDLKKDLKLLLDARITGEKDSKEFRKVMIENEDILDVVEGFLCFSREDYSEAAEFFKSVYDPLLSGSFPGFLVTVKDIITQTYIESLIRAGELEEAQRLLNERVVLLPNDAQTWRRLSNVSERLGNDLLAETANYNAWQLGIGQGGFGGPK